MSLQELQNYTFVSKYAKWSENKQRRETWSEAVDRVKNMMLIKYKDFPEVHDDIEWAYGMMKRKKVLGSQRALQFGGDPILRRNLRIFNCISSNCDRLRFFQECMYLLLCGCGTGFSVQKHHIDKLPKLLKEKSDKYKKFTIPDSIEGWSDAIGVLVSSYFKQNELFCEYNGYRITFDFSEIRTKGSKISSGGKAPGPEPLKNALNKIKNILDNAIVRGGKLKPIEAYDIIMHSSDAVLAGGVRRSATLCMFSYEDDEMMSAKTGNWFHENPQRGRSNNSVVLVRDQTSKDQFLEIIEKIKQFGEPGFILTDSKEGLYNPCQPGWAKICKLDEKSNNSIIQTFENLEVGDKIWSTEGWTTVTNKVYTGEKPVFRYRTTAGTFYGTENHLIPASDSQKIEIKYADHLQIITGPVTTFNYKDLGEDFDQFVMDGLVLGDGGTHKASNNLIGLYIGEDDQDYFSDRINKLIVKHRPGINSKFYTVKTTLLPEELPNTVDRKIPQRFICSSEQQKIAFLRGIFSANGSVCNNRITLKSSSYSVIEDVQLILSSIGIRSYFTTNKSTKVKFENGEYECKQSYDLNITVDRIHFINKIGFIQNYKNNKLQIVNSSKIKTEYSIISVDPIGTEKVYDIAVDNNSHTYWTQGCNVSNCVEIGLFGYNSKGESGWEACNLSTINGAKVKDEQEFYDCCAAAAIIGTLQAGFTDVGYLTNVSQEIIEREALLGVSMTGIMENPSICLDERIQKNGAETVKSVNRQISQKIAIKQAARTTCVKPEGSSSCVLGTSSGIHPHHAKRYIRRIQANKLENVYSYFKQSNPRACEESVWSNNITDDVISFCVEVPDGSKIKNQVDALSLLEAVKSTQINWVNSGKNKDLCVQPWLSHNVSNTISIKPEEWNTVAEFIYDNREYFCGISLLPITGDKDYPQAPFASVYTPSEMMKHYGDGIMFISGLIEQALELFEDNLWSACEVLLGLGGHIRGSSKKEWISRCTKFSINYFDGDIRRLTYAMKDIYNYKLWTELNREYKNVDYSQLIETEDNTKVQQEIACAGGKCEI